MENILKFKKVRVFGSKGELSKEEIEKLGLPTDEYFSLDECAYQCAYDMSEDWLIDNPTWNDIQEAYKKGVEDALKYIKENETLR